MKGQSVGPILFVAVARGNAGAAMRLSNSRIGAGCWGGAADDRPGWATLGDGGPYRSGTVRHGAPRGSANICRSQHVTRIVSHHKTPLCRAANSYKLLRMPRNRFPQHTAFRLVLLGVDAHAVSDIHCR